MIKATSSQMIIASVNNLNSNSDSQGLKTIRAEQGDRYSTEEQEEKEGILSALRGIGISISSAEGGYKSKVCDDVASARNYLKDSKNNFTNEILENENFNEERYNGSSFLSFNNNLNLLVGNHLFGTSTNSLATKDIPIEDKPDLITTSLSVKVQYLSNFDEINGCMVPVWKDLESNSDSTGTQLFCRLLPDSRQAKNLNFNASIDSKIIDEFVIVENNELSRATSRTVMSPDSVVKNTVLQPGISEFFSEAGDGEEPVIVQSKILESLKSLGFGKELEDDYSATVFSSSIKVVQPQIVISFGSDFNSTGFNGRPTLSNPQLNPQNRTMVSNPTGRFVQAMPKVSESDSFSINRNGNERITELSSFQEATKILSKSMMETKTTIINNRGY